MDGVRTVIKAQQASDRIIAHVAQAKEVLATVNCRKQSEEQVLMSTHELEASLRAARKELAAALRIMRRTVWPKGSASDAYVRWRSDQISRGLLDE